MPLGSAEHVVFLSVAILVVLFLFQRFGTNKVSFSFSPIMLLWFSFTATIGLYNIIKFYPSILKALSPHYIFYFFQRNHRKGWELLGAIALCITGWCIFLDFHVSLRRWSLQKSYNKDLLLQELKPCLLILVTSTREEFRQYNT